METMVEGTRRVHGHGLSTFRLKVIGDALLTLSALGTTVLPDALGNPGSDDLTGMTILVACELVSWCAVPIFAWLLCEGYRHTSSVPWYLLRLAVLAVVSEVPYDLATSGKVVDWSSQNPVIALVVGVLVLVVIDWADRFPRATRTFIVVLASVSGLLWMLVLRVGVRQRLVNVGLLIVAFVLVFRLLRRRENTMMFTAGLVGALAFVLPAVGVAVLHYHNDELGYGHRWTPWVFYAFYPVMLAACGLAVVA
ncbi:TraX family protein [uncultured Bifidobacterium sp.]|uniref:TraX family protein n=1 Tax=uncultured Bifidobacterium sp. TaxID=165187 RepID=UPI0028DC462A|nr:TraX family protein [uncultured Bifidobacterium sp.]